MALSVNTLVYQISDNNEHVLLEPSTNICIKNLTVVLENSDSTRHFNLWMYKDTDKALLSYNQSVTENGVYFNDIYLGNGNKITIFPTDLASGETLHITVQYAEII